MPSYSLTKTHLEIKTEEGLIKITFPQRWWKYFKAKYEFGDLETLSFEMKQKLFLYALGDFKNICLSIEEASVICLRLWESKEDNLSAEEEEMYGLMYKCVEMAYLIRRVELEEARKTAYAYYRELFDYYEKKLPILVADHTLFRWDNYLEGTSTDSDRTKNLYFQGDDRNLSFEQLQQGLTVLVNDFLEGSVTSLEMINFLPNTDKNGSYNKGEEDQLKYLIFNIKEDWYYFPTFGSLGVFVSIAKYHNKRQV